MTVFAASSLTEALREASAAIERAGGPGATLAFGSSGSLARQLAAGAPGDVFLSANADWVEWLAERGMCEGDERRAILGNGLVVVVPSDSAVAWDRLEDLKGAGRVVVANTRAAPAGIYARQALEKCGIWESLRGRTIEAENVRTALTLVARGEADAGVVYATDAAATDRVRVAFRVPRSLHEEIRYVAVMVSGGGSPEAPRSWVEHLQSEAMRAVFERYGFEVLR